MENKRGVTEIQIMIIQMLLAIIVLVALFYFVSGHGKTSALKEQILSKQTAMLIDASQPSDIIYISKKDYEGFIIEIDETSKTVLVKSDEFSNGYAYDYFVNNKITLGEDEENWILKIE